ncbi:vomeronasal type-2 receptor 26-like [Hyperolius riggenbachi]|uniref:vomeronasal type-2 receptor 26-like n=1 Tax=Hyperolius riggenbachi TaxID=752182 RepID=UPI0035A2A9B8
MACLANIQQRNNLPVRRLICDSPTRWNSMILMFDHLLQQEEAINKYLYSYGARADSGELGIFLPRYWTLMHNACRLMHPFEEVTNLMSRSEGAISDLIPYVFFLEHAMRRVVDQDVEQHEQEEEEELISYGIYTATYALAHALHAMMTIAGKAKNQLSNFQQWKMPQSVCCESCKAGYRKVKRDKESPCCYDCVQCPDGEISNSTDSQRCFKCSTFEKHNHNRDQCIPKDIQILTYKKSLSILITLFSLLLFSATVAIFGTFWKCQASPVVKANNPTLSYILLISLMFSFLCPLLFMGQPSSIRCLLQLTAFGVAFTVSVSTIFSKTLIVLIAFNATKPGSKLKKLLRTRWSITMICLCSLAEILLTVSWISSSPPFPDVSIDTDTVVLVCNVGSVPAFFLEIGYIGLLALTSLATAFLAKDFPDRYNEAKNISFSMLIFLSVWTAFVPTYLSSSGINMVAVEIFAILSSSAGLLCCIFLPKCYVIFLRPDLNRR